MAKLLKKREQKVKEVKRKPKYGMLSCVKYIYQFLWQTEKALVFTGIFAVPIGLGLSALALYTPSVILSALEGTDRFSNVGLIIVGLLLAKLLLELVNNIISIKIENSEHYFTMQMDYHYLKMRRERDWYLEYDVEVEKLNERAENAYMNNHSAGVHFPMEFSNMLSQALNFLLFGSVISLLHPIIIVLLALGSGLNLIMQEWANKKNWEERDARNQLDKKINYITFLIAQDFRYAKDIRLYNMKKPLKERLENLFSLREVEQKKVERRSIVVAMENFLIVLLRDGLAYAFLIYKAMHGEMDASSFVLYFSAITSMSEVMGRILGTINWVSEGAMQISDYREAMEITGKLNRGAGLPVPKGPFSIEFKNVSFQYPKGEKKVLDNVSFKMEAGEKIALVGLNGAGKTSLTQLMCGMLLPDEGEILLDGHTLFEYNRDDMYALFGVVPQNYHLLPVSIARNIASAMEGEKIDYDRLQYCIQMAGLTEKIQSLPKGIETPLNREVNRDGIELSGGETQKLLLARLLYKNPPFIILDEPTAALDPIAEDRMYRRYNEITENATSVFISHRLASTRFCDRIFLLDGANFAEVGTHEELMAAGGKYRELFDIQSKYYKEEADKNEQ